MTHHHVVTAEGLHVERKSPVASRCCVILFNLSFGFQYEYSHQLYQVVCCRADQPGEKAIPFNEPASAQQQKDTHAYPSQTLPSDCR
jgi:hypothetical protein